MLRDYLLNSLKFGIELLRHQISVLFGAGSMNSCTVSSNQQLRKKFAILRLTYCTQCLDQDVEYSRGTNTFLALKMCCELQNFTAYC